MKTSFLLAGVLLLSAPVVAQQPLVVAPDTAVPAPEPSGYDLLVQAGNKLLPGPNGSPSTVEKLTPDENLRWQRLAVKRNAPALALVRQALEKPITIPLATDYTDPGFRVSAKVRELARQFSQEAAVRLADGDVSGAMNSKLDTIEMGVRYENGIFISMLVGVAIESIGRKDIEEAVSQLDAEQCRSAIARLKTIEARRPSYTQVLQNEEAQTQILLTSILGEAQKQVLAAEGRQNAEVTEKDADLIALMTPEKVKNDISLLFAPIIKNAALPYQQSLRLRVQPSNNPLLKPVGAIFVEGRSRFNYERSLTANLLMMSALELRARKLETGAYPERFATPIDPFSPDAKTLVYKKTVRDYVLYSVGTDGKDDNGAELQSLRTDPTTGIKTVSELLTIEAQGDIVRDPL